MLHKSRAISPCYYRHIRASFYNYWGIETNFMFFSIYATAHPEHGGGGRVGRRAVRELGLPRQVLERLDRKEVLRDGERHDQVADVGGGEDDGEDPPAADDEPRAVGARDPRRACVYSNQRVTSHFMILEPHIIRPMLINYNILIK